MIRRNARLRREYLYQRSLEEKERQRFEKKRKIRQALAEGKPIPSELRGEDRELRQEMELEDVYTAAPRSGIDDEYRSAAEKDPKVMVTTSRDPSSRLSQFAKELKLIFPNSQRVNRGSQVVSELVESCRQSEYTDLVIVHEHRGKPDGITISHMPYGPTAFFGMVNCVLRHDIKDRDLGTMSEAKPHLIFENFSSRLGQRACAILKHLFPEPKASSRRVMTFFNQSDFISFRHHTYDLPKGGAGPVALSEVGPRFELRLFQIRLGTVDQDEAEIEWSLRPFMRSGKKPKL